MTALSNYFENAILNWFRGTAFPAATGSVYVALFTAAPSDAGGGTEVSGGSYARVAVSKAAGSWSAPADVSGSQEISNVAVIAFPTATADWGTVTHFGIFDAATVGNLIFHGALTASRVVSNGTDVSIPAGSLKLRAA